MTVRVSQQGAITLPLLGDIQAEGLTTSAVEQALQERYKKYLRNPQAGVKVGEYHSQRVSVIGAVKTPGVIELSGPQTLIDVLALAGGVSDKAGMQVHLYRQGMAGREKYVIDLYALAATNETANMVVSGGDVVNVPQAGTFFVDGAVQNPGSYLLDRPYSLSQALIKAGGVDIELAQTSTITLLQRRGPGPLTVNLDEVMAGKIVDPQVGPEDVIVVPVHPAKYLVKRFIGVLFTGSNLTRMGF
jgi:polysaccharide export outer membrane protein